MSRMIDTVQHDLATRVTTRLRESGLSQKAMAYELGMSRTALNARMAGRARYIADELPDIAAMLGTTVAELVGEAS